MQLLFNHIDLYKMFLLYAIRILHWVKTVQIKRLFGSKYEYMQTRENSVFGHILGCDIKNFANTAGGMFRVLPNIYHETFL